MRNVTIVADDKVGLLADISYILAKSKINIDSISVEVISAKAIITIGLSDGVRGKQVIEAAGYRVENPEAIVIKFQEKAGELNKITTMLKKEGVDVKGVNILTKDNTTSIAALTVDKHKRATAVLKQYLIINESEY
ncbi:ACT domain protein [Candidatus Bilamarchaeum dharawalense]|uniref:ACT domain protein n=1 Tax=Candidatus Bilamarchaeum dharawalense TaxID=2885759 RepID=A0A5E4LNX6_9ARCH|nr:ACT domain protein [Candidatus Bilamarchaeum dharawalense]